MRDKRIQSASRREMLEEDIGSITSPGREMLRVLGHYPKKRARKRLNERPMVNWNSVSGTLHAGVSENVTDAFVGVPIQQLPNRRAGLARFTDEGTEPAGQHPLC